MTITQVHVAMLQSSFEKIMTSAVIHNSKFSYLSQEEIISSAQNS